MQSHKAVETTLQTECDKLREARDNLAAQLQSEMVLRDVREAELRRHIEQLQPLSARSGARSPEASAAAGLYPCMSMHA